MVIALASLLQNTEESELIAIASATLSHLGAIAIDDFVALLAELKYRKLATRSLAYIRRPQTLPALLNLAEDPDVEIRTIAIKVIGSFHDYRVPPILINALQDPAASVRKEAAIASETLSHLGAIAIDVFVALLAEPKYRKLATRSLA